MTIMMALNRINKAALILFILYLAVVGYCCFWDFHSLPNVGPTLLGFPMDKVVHFIMFFPFPILCFLAFDSHTKKPWQALLAVTIVFIVGCLVAAVTEIGQSFTTYRSGDKNDFIADVLAIAVSSVITLTVDLLKMKIKSKDEA